MRRGYLVVEVLLAAGLFVTFATGAIVAVVSSWDANRRAQEQTVAMQYLSEGLEAARSIKNQAFANLTDGAKGLARSTGVWSFSGSNNSTDSGRYTRTILVTPAQRNAGGGLVDSGGTPDPNTKKVTSQVTWNFSAARPQDLSVSTYMTNWKAGIGPSDNAILFYGDNVTAPTNEPRYRLYTNSVNTFGAETSTALAGANAKNVVVRTSPVKREAIAGYTDSAGNLRILCFDGSIWSTEWSVTVGGTGTTRRFDIAYETNSGDVLVLYSTNAGTNELDYQTKPGSLGCGAANWVDQTAFDSPGTTGVVQWVKAAWDRRSTSNFVAAIWADSASDLQGAMWSGSAWTQRAAAFETSMEVVAAAQDVDDFDVEFESTSGDVVVVWANSAGANGTNGVRYATWTASTSIWSSATTPPTFADDATNLDISANPTNDQIIFASIGNAGSDLQVGRWDGSAWANVANKDTSAAAPLAGTELVATGWLISGGTTRGIVVYNDSATTNINYLTMTPGAPPTWSATLNSTPAPVFGNPRKWTKIEMDPLNQARLVLILSDVNVDLFAKRLEMSGVPAFTWTNSDGSAAMETTLGQATAQPFSFAYWRL